MVAVVVNDGSLYRSGFAGDESRAVFLPITDRSKKPSIEVKIDLWMKVNEQDFLSILRLRHFFWKLGPR